MTSMDEFQKMVHLLDMAWLLRGEIVPCLVGPPGIGKTAAVMEHARNHGCGKVVKIVASRCIPSETVGMTMPNHERRSMEIYNSIQLSTLEDGDVLFLDELLEADQFVLSTLLTVIESREMADGTPLPDIQIIAATNDTIPPEHLKGNIRQRFMFQRFGVSKDATKRYILDKTGIQLPDTVLRQLTERGNDYNFLTPRSLTKLCLWISQAESKEQASEVANVINDIWNSVIGSEIYLAWSRAKRKVKSPIQQLREAILDIAPEVTMDNDNFADCTVEEMYDILSSLPEWDDISKMLAARNLEEEEEEEVDIQF